ncbi:MAG TPA: hypothetical protein VK835_07925 [Bacteroidia bacterium]|jgi:hypothetical protein|nr:hypothetical protein [Bacteroidia bacterium]
MINDVKLGMLFSGLYSSPAKYGFKIMRYIEDEGKLDTELTYKRLIEYNNQFHGISIGKSDENDETHGLLNTYFNSQIHRLNKINTVDKNNNLEMTLFDYKKALKIAQIRLESPLLTQEKRDLIKIRIVNINHHIEELEGQHFLKEENKPLIQNPNPIQQPHKNKTSWLEKMYWAAGIGVFLFLVYDKIKSNYPEFPKFK